MEPLKYVDHPYSQRQVPQVPEKVSIGVDPVQYTVEPTFKCSVRKITKEELQRDIVNILPEFQEEKNGHSIWSTKIGSHAVMVESWNNIKISKLVHLLYSQTKVVLVQVWPDEGGEE